jgi:uncharacterized protein (TIGR02588 family)
VEPETKPAIAARDVDASLNQLAARHARRNAAQWITTGVSVALIAVLAGLILYEGYIGPGGRPAALDVAVRPEGVERRGDRYYVPFTVTNRGDETVEEVTLDIQVMSADEVIEEAQTVVALLGEGSTERGMLVLDNDPAGLTIDAAVSSFQIADE